MKLFLIFVYLSLKNAVSVDGFPTPSYESGWLAIETRAAGKTEHYLSHGLDQMPLLVDVQVRSMEQPNYGYSFPAIGTCQREDDHAESYGGIAYVYNQNEIQIAAPKRRNEHDSGRSIYTASDTFYAGLNSQSSDSAYVKVRVWTAERLPSPTYSATGIAVTAGSSSLDDVYIEREHGLNEYPALVVVRTKLTDGTMVGYMSDAVGSSMMNTNSGTASRGIVVFAYNETTVRVWIPSHSYLGHIIVCDDGYGGIQAVAKSGEVEIYVWTKARLHPSFTGTGYVGMGATGDDFNLPFQYNIQDAFVKVWAQAITGDNAGFMFEGSGAAAYYSSTADTNCTYGGLQYAYDEQGVRLWRPTGEANSGVICVANSFGLGTNGQASTDANITVSVWIIRQPTPAQDYADTSWLNMKSNCGYN